MKVYDGVVVQIITNCIRKKFDFGVAAAVLCALLISHTEGVRQTPGGPVGGALPNYGNTVYCQS